MMKKTKNILRRTLITALAVAVIGSASVLPSVSTLIGTNVTVSAASSSPVVTVGDWQYVLYSDKTARVVGYTGTKNLSTTNVAMPTVIYSKDIDTTWSYNDYIGSYNITQMQAGIFNGCKFKTLSLPRYLQGILGGFTGAEIGGFFIDSNNSYFSSTYFSGAYALYNKDNTTLYAYPSNPSLYVSGFGTETRGFPSTLTRIEDQAFASSKLNTVTIPASVTYMGDRVFTGSNVNYVTFEGNAPTFRFMPSSTIPDHGTFEGASNLYQINIKGKNGDYNTDSYGMVYNKDMTRLVLVPQGKTSAFNVASTCTEIGDYAFYHSNVNGPVIYDQVKTIDSYAFYGVKSNFKVYCLKDTPTDTFVKNNNIPYVYAYEYTTASDGVTITKYNGPYSSPGVPSTIKGKDVIAIGSEAFRNNDNLTSVYLYSPIATIGDYAFYDCDSLTKVSMPYTVTSIGERAFYSCNKLTFNTLPSSLTKIGVYAFGYCTSLTDIIIPNSVKQLSYSAFYGCSALTNVKLGTGLTSIGAYAFENTGLTSQYIPKNVTSVGSYAFGFNYSDSVHSRNTAFESISGYPDSGAETYANKYDIPFNSDIQYSVDDGEVTIKKYTGTDTNLVIPDTIGGKPVTDIAGYAFNGTNVTSVTLPSGMTELNGYAFYGASKLTSVTFPSDITSIGSYAFEFCTSLKYINIPSTVTYIGNGAFYGCKSLQMVNLGAGVKSIGKYCFTNTVLTNVTIPRSVTSIGDYAFGYNYSDSTYSAVSGFKMTGYAYTAADEYASANTHITFNPLYDNILNTSTISASEVDLGKEITVNASATGGKLPFEYYVSYKDSFDNLTVVQAYSSNTAVNISFPKAGEFTVTVTARDNRNYTLSKNFTVKVNDVAPLVNKSVISKTTISLGDTVTVTGKAEGGQAPYTYAVLYKKDSSTTWTVAQAYKANDKVELNLKSAVKYNVCVKVKDATGKIVKKTFNVNVVKPLVNSSTISAETIKKGESVIVTGKASGGPAPYLYAVYYKKTSSKTWSTAQTYKENSKVKITPASVTKYDICVKVKDNKGKIEKKYFEVTVTK